MTMLVKKSHVKLYHDPIVNVTHIASIIYGALELLLIELSYVLHDHAGVG